MAIPDPTRANLRPQDLKALSILASHAAMIQDVKNHIAPLVDRHREAFLRAQHKLFGVIEDRRQFQAAVRELAPLDADARAALELEPEAQDDVILLILATNSYPLLLEALTCRNPAEALGLLESDDTMLLSERAVATGVLAWEYTPNCSARELASCTELFIKFLEANREPLTRTGLPDSHFDCMPWLDAIAPLYPTAQSKWIKPPDLIGRDGGGPWLAHTRLRLLLMRGCCASEYAGCECEIGDMANLLSLEDVKRINTGRAHFFDLKVAVIRQLHDAARRQGADGLWEACLTILTKSLRASDAEFWLRVDEAYAGAEIRKGVLTTNSGQAAVGGLSALLRMIGWYESNLSIGMMNATHKAFACLPGGGRPVSYFDLAGQPKRKHLDKALDRLRSLAVKSREAWADFGSRVNSALNGEFEEEILVPVRVKKSVARRFQADADAWAGLVSASANLGVLPSEFDPSGAASRSRTKADLLRIVQPFPSPPGLRWEEVTFRFVSETAVRIRARGIEKVYTFTEIGFKDGRKTESPDSSWEMLRYLSRNYGEIVFGKDTRRQNAKKRTLDEDAPSDPEDEPRETVRDAAKFRVSSAKKTAIKDLRKRLRALLGINDDPFYPYRSVGAYRAKFSIIDHGNYERVGSPTEDV